MTKRNRDGFHGFSGVVLLLGCLVLAGLNMGAIFLPLPDVSNVLISIQPRHSEIDSSKLGGVLWSQNTEMSVSASDASEVPPSNLDRMLEVKWHSYRAIATSS